MTYVVERKPRVGDISRRVTQIDDPHFKRACEKVGIADFHFHDLRHTWASWHAHAGTPLKALQQLMGWETLEMVHKYARLAPSHLAAHANTVKIWTKSSDKEKTPLSLAA
ncbi:tyrosine-type recombinase/integrase [Bordetella sp. FB-8]|uniref:tyrosine-type recombinase/integrase n=1 Tax=Bordetella sp. FB-8 TaxID=1159870 RepID=UPI0012DD3A2F|nr:tyrosine-type recombinase/integrase [Bordetella sp. FB-8]